MSPRPHGINIAHKQLQIFLLLLIEERSYGCRYHRP